MAPQNNRNGQKDISSYFKWPAPSQVTPAKRRSPALEESDRVIDRVRAPATPVKHSKSSSNPTTPTSTTRLKDVGSVTPKKRPIGPPKPGTPAHVAFRSPKPKSPFNREESSSLSELSSIPSSLSTIKLLFDRESVEKEEQVQSTHDLTSSALSQPHSTQKVVHKGQLVAVRDSDEDDSDSSLEDLDDLLGRKKEPMTSSSSPPSADDVASTYDISRWMGRPKNVRSGPIVEKEVFSKFRNPEPKYHNGIERLLNHHFDDQETEASLAKVKKSYEEAEKVVGQREYEKGREGVDQKLLKSVTEGRDEDGPGLSRLLEAVKRTDALNGDKVWSFFNGNPCHGNTHYDHSFPREALRTNPWEACLDDTATRRRAFLSGYTAEKWNSRSVSRDLLLWTFSAVVSEPRDDLRSMYSLMLARASPSSLAEHVDSSEVSRVFSLLGASLEAYSDAKEPLQPNRSVNAPYKDADWRYLISALETFALLIPHLTNETLHTLSIVAFRLSLDTHLMSNLRASLAVESLMTHLLSPSLPKPTATTLLSHLHQNLFTTLTIPALQAQLLKHVTPSSHRAATFRVRLARSFLLNQPFPFDPETLIDDIDAAPVSLSTLTAHLKSNPRYDVMAPQKSSDFKVRTSEYDYPSLTSWAQLLDIAINDGVGLSPPSEKNLTPPFHADKKAEAGFNADVDRLADRVKEIASSIRDTGASHMRRTEAKGALESVYWRLIVSVRTKPRPKKTAFGREWQEVERGAGVMQGWLGKGEA